MAPIIHTVALTAVVVVTASVFPARAQTQKAPDVRSLTTLEAQKKLVEGLTPVAPKMRFRRDLDAPKAAEPLRLPPPPYDLRDTKEAKLGLVSRSRNS